MKKMSANDDLQEKEPKKGKIRTTVKERFIKRNVLGSLVLCCALGFTVGYFSPGDIFIAGQADFFVSAASMLGALLSFAAAISAALWCVMLLALLAGSGPFSVVRDIFTGLLLAMYVQMLFFNGGLNVMSGDGDAIDIQSVSSYINTAVYVQIIFIPMYYHLYKKDKTDAQLLEKRCARISLYAAAVIFLLQFVGNAGLIISNGIEERGNAVGYLSYDGVTEFSEKNNVVVFLTDKLDGSLVDRTIEDYPDVCGVLEGFTYYRDNISRYSHTFPSVADMLSGHSYGTQSVSGFLGECWSDDNMLKTASEHGVRVNLLIDGVSTYHSLNDLSGFTNNYREAENVSVNYIGKNGVIPTMYTLSMLKLSPYTIKALYSYKMESWRAEDFFEFESDLPDKVDRSVSPMSDEMFYKYITSHEFRTDGGAESVFTFIHLNAVHDLNAAISNLVKEEPLSGDCDNQVELTRGTFCVIDEYIKKMKELGVFDCSTIIILADHGIKPSDVQHPGDKLEKPLMTALLIKPANAGKEPLMTDETTRMSNEYFTASVLEALGLPHDKYGISYSDVINGASSPRRLTVYRFNASNTPPSYICDYEINGSGLDFSNWQYSFDESK